TELSHLYTLSLHAALPISRGAVEVSADYLEYFAGWADKIGGETVPTTRPGALDYTIRHPVGVVAAIVPWNAPVFLAVAKLAPARSEEHTSELQSLAYLVCR